MPLKSLKHVPHLSRIVLLIEKFRPTKSYQNQQLQTKTYIETYIEIRFAIVWGSSKKPKHANECSCFLAWQVKEKVLQQSLRFQPRFPWWMRFNKIQ